MIIGGAILVNWWKIMNIQNMIGHFLTNDILVELSFLSSDRFHPNYSEGQTSKHDLNLSISLKT